MHSAIGMLWQSQKLGRHEEKQKYSSVHKGRSLHTNFHNALVRGAVNNLVLCSAKSRMVVMTAPSNSEWHTRFMAGYHARVGELRKQDAAISLPQILAVQELLEEEWQEASMRGDLGEMHSVAEMGAFFLARYCESFSGFELPKILLTELKDQIRREDSRHEVAHVGIPLRGCFKARGKQCKGEATHYGCGGDGVRTEASPLVVSFGGRAVGLGNHVQLALPK